MAAAAAAAAGWRETSFDADKLSHEIFSILESNFLFGYDPTEKPSPSRGKVRILSIDGVDPDGALLAGASLVRLESLLRELSGDSDARVADFFDLAAGSGAGGVLAAMLFIRGPDGRPLLSAADALLALADHRRAFVPGHRGGVLKGIFRRSKGAALRGIFGGATLRDAVKPLLVPCYDLLTAAPFVFSRADAVEADAFDFPIWSVCAATCGAAEVRSVNGGTRIRSAGGTAAMGNPAASAITHVLHNKQEFPFVAGVENLFVLSLGSCVGAGPAAARAADLLRIAGACQADMVDQAVAMAFGESRETNYVRIQGNGLGSGRTAEAVLTELSVESVLLKGRKITERTNGEQLERAAGEVVGEQRRRERSQIPTVLIKPTVTPPRTSSSSSSATTVITASTADSSSP